MSALRAATVILAAVILFIACRKKMEILPDAAKQVVRLDRSETTDAGDVYLREYRFALPDGKNGSHTFICEARSFSDIESAKSSAAKAMAERPQVAAQKENVRFAASGRSVWLWQKKELVWCMLTTPQVTDISTAVQPVVAKFKKQYEDAS